MFELPSPERCQSAMSLRAYHYRDLSDEEGRFPDRIVADAIDIKDVEPTAEPPSCSSRSRKSDPSSSLEFHEYST